MDPLGEPAAAPGIRRLIASRPTSAAVLRWGNTGRTPGIEERLRAGETWRRSSAGRLTSRVHLQAIEWDAAADGDAPQR